MKLNEFSKSELKEILTKQGWDNITTWGYMTTAVNELGVYRLFLSINYLDIDDVKLGLTLFRELGLDNTFNLHEKYVGRDDELFNLELVRAERALRTFERECGEGWGINQEELVELLKKEL